MVKKKRDMGGNVVLNGQDEDVMVGAEDIFIASIAHLSLLFYFYIFFEPIHKNNHS